LGSKWAAGESPFGSDTRPAYRETLIGRK
jgi:hypothetical protein